VSARTRALPAWAITAALALAYVIVAPPSTDLAAAGYRSDLFSRAGLTLWDNGWYGGHHLLGYSLLAPGLGALLGVQLLAALSMTAAAALFERLLDARAPQRATRLASLWFALGAAVSLLSNRVAFDLGLALGLAALVAAAAHAAARRATATHADSRRALGAGVRGERPAAGTDRASARQRGSGARGRAAAALGLAALCALASPVAGAFLALATLAWAFGGGGARRLALAMMLAALAPIALLAMAFPEGGTEPFVASAFYPALVQVLLLLVAIGPSERTLRMGALLYALALLGAYALASPVGGNATRLGALMAGPVLAYALVGRAPAGATGAGQRPAEAHDVRPAPSRARARRWRTAALAALAVALAYWQVKPPISDFVSAASNPTANASYYAPLVAQLRRLDLGYGARPARVEVVPTRNRGEARWVADAVPIARGWQRQLERKQDGLFYEGDARPSSARYRAWLSEQAISYVALGDGPLDYSARGEARVIAGAPSYLREVWRSAHWRLFAVADATPLAQRPSVLTRLDSDAFTLRAPAPGTFVVRVRFSSYWALKGGHGCVRRGPGDWTQVQTRSAGAVRVAIDFTLGRVFAHGARCR
jgi:hypothetical protein